MMRPRTMFLAVAGWLGVVLAVSVLTWSVIDSAGQEVLGADEPAVVGTTDPSLRPPRPEPSRTPVPSQTAPATTPDSGTEGPSETPPSRPATTASSPAPDTRIGTWRGSAGTVVVACTDARVELRSATPSDDWRVQVDKRGPEEVEVDFERTGEAEGEVKVDARCRDGVPRFSVETE